jgi:hypothetical protein
MRIFHVLKMTVASLGEKAGVMIGAALLALLPLAAPGAWAQSPGAFG